MSKHSPTPHPAPPAPDARLLAIDEHKKHRAEERQKRLAVLQEVAKERSSVVISYVTSSRGVVGSQVGWDAVRFMRELLDSVGHVETIDLCLITRGGNILTPLRLISLLREFGKKVNVLVPYMALSAGTLIALGADEIVMGAMGELGPVDPSVSNQFNPILEAEDIQGQANTKPRPRIPISVEDVTSYLNFAKSNAALDSVGMAQAFTALTTRVHPLALGNILRNHNLIRHLAKALLLMHMNATADKDKIELIVKKLTEELFSHEYLITRDEASRIGLKAVKPSDKVENDMWQLYRLYEEYFGIDRAVQIGAELGTERQKYLCFDVGIIETEKTAHTFCTKGWGVRKGSDDFEFKADAQGWEN
jgi:hypothetical protein